MNSVFVTHFKGAITTQDYCNKCKVETEFIMDHYIKKEPKMLIIQVDRKLGEKNTLKINLDLYLDDIWIFESMSNFHILQIEEKLKNEDYEEKLDHIPAKHGPLKLCAYSLYALISEKQKDVLASTEFYSAFVKHGDS